ncbi:MAG TPA: hypothetical protein VGC92_08630, partial [Phenylobacterium sp.]
MSMPDLRLTPVICLVPLLSGCGQAVAPPRATILHPAPLNHSSDADTPVRRRLLARFPIGGPEAGLAEYLKAQGFDVVRHTQAASTGDQVYAEAT